LAIAIEASRESATTTYDEIMAESNIQLRRRRRTDEEEGGGRGRWRGGIRSKRDRRREEVPSLG